MDFRERLVSLTTRMSESYVPTQVKVIVNYKVKALG